jgi:hypothetical protein
MKGFIAILLVLCTLGLSGCGFTGFTFVTGSGNVVSESRQVVDFDAVTMAGSGDLIITQGDQEGLKIDAEDNLIPYIRTEVRGHTLYIDMNTRNFVSLHTTRPIRFYLSMKEVSGLTLSGSGTITSKNINTKNLDINISGSGDTVIDNLQADSLSTDISGSGKCILKGEVASQKVTITGSGDYNTSGLTSKDVIMNVSGSGKTSVTATNTLNVTITGSGEVAYSGNPKITQTITGSGKMVAR